MRKVVLLGLCVLFVGSVSVFAAYAVSGQVKDESGNPVNGVTVYINCYPSGVAAYPTVTTTSGPVAGVMGWYSGGWTDKNCMNEKIVVKAVSSDGSKSGTLTWTAGSVADANKDVTIKASPFSTFELHCEASPVAMSEAHAVGISTVNLYMQLAYVGAPIMANGGMTTLKYNPSEMQCVNVTPRPPFNDFSFVIDPAGGTVTVTAHAPVGMLVPIGHGNVPTSFFDVFFEPTDVSEPHIATVEVAAEIEGQIEGMMRHISAFPSQTEFLLGTPHTSSGHFLIDSQLEWEERLFSGYVRPMMELEWTDYMSQWNLYPDGGEPYPTTTFLPPELEVYGGGGGGGLNPEDAGLVMKWGDESTPAGSYASAWKYDYGVDPDLSNSIITITVTAPQFGSAGQINAVSFGIQDINGNIRSWWWSCGPASAPIPWNTPTTITIDTTQIGLAAANPPATGFMNNLAFNLTLSQFLIVDENFQWVGGPQAVPPPGQILPRMWNYWHNLVVTKKTNTYKGIYVKWSQPPVLDPQSGFTLLIRGWDEVSVYQPPIQPQQIMADDWLCTDNRPITDLHWWGSFIGWTQPNLPPVLPKAFHIGIWTDVPAGVDQPYSHPGVMVWEHTCSNWVWNFAGYDIDPRLEPIENEACFQFNQLLSQDDWFYQEPGGPEGRVYWLSIAAIYDTAAQVQYPWGWKTREKFYNDDAVRIVSTADGLWPPRIGSVWGSGNPVEYPAGTSWDLTFELTTNEKAYVDDPIPGDIGGPGGSLTPDGTVNLDDLAILAAHWLMSAP